MMLRIKYLVVMLLLLLPLAGFCRDKQKQLKLPVSRWREVRRMGLDSTAKAFTDTLYITFRRKDSFSYHNKDGFIYNGGYTISEDSLLDLGTARYKIAVKRPYTLVFADEKAYYVMGPDNSDTMRTDVIVKEDSALPVKDIDLMIGHWTVYKKVTERAAESIDFSTEIKAVDITGPSSDDKQGFVYGGLDAKNRPSWFIQSMTADQTLSCGGKNPRTIKVLRCQKGEMILEEEGIKYYLKQFK